jgi:pyruvate/2-oxoglutarate dehydrogenase complex dihydrolipoamide dehydrogenase (E3) component
MAERFDAIVIGAGQAGIPLCARLDQQGLTAALIERDRLGGTCVNYGCIPTKTLVESARVAALSRRAGDYGVRHDGVAVDMKAVCARKDRVVGQFAGHVRELIDGMKKVTLVHGHGRFVAPHAVNVDARTLEAPKIFINVGARPLVPGLPGTKDVPFFTSSTLLAVDFLPPHLVIVGGSYAGLEFAQIYRRFGSAVTVVEREARVLPKEDEDVAAGVRSIFQREGISVRTEAECLTLSKTSSGVAVGLKCAQGPPVAEGSHVLLAVGRRPNTDDLGVDRAGIRTDERGYIVVDDELRTNVSGVWALGEVNGRGAFTHTAYNDYEIVAANLFEHDRRRVTDRITAYALYIDPPLGRAGMTAAQAGETGRRVLHARLAMEDVGRAREADETQGFMKVLVDADTMEILGAAILGMGGDEVVHSLLDTMYAKAAYTRMKYAVHIHPTVAEFIPTLFGNLQPLG